MAGFTPDEGERVIAQVVHQRTHVDRDADLSLGLLTNVAPGETLALAAITEPTGVDAAGPFTFANGDTYKITPNITVG